MIVFDGVALEDIAPVRVEDIRVSPVEMNATTRARAIFPGSQFVRMRYGTRTVTVTFAVQVENLLARQAALLAISEWAKSDNAYKLELPHQVDKYLECVCTGKPEPSLRQWWEAKLRLVFTCYDNPFWTSKIEKQVVVNTNFYVFGDAMPLMRIERDVSTAVSATQRYDIGDRYIRLSALPVGKMVLDLNKQTITSTSGSTTTNIVENVIVATSTMKSAFPIPEIGNTRVTANTSGSGTSIVYYRERWQ
jgi:phage-related protein